MRFQNILVTLAFCLLLSQCQNNNRFSIEIKHFAGAVGVTRYYSVTDKFIRVDSDCDFENCKRRTIYTRNLTNRESDSLLTILKSLKLDTLKEGYSPKEKIYDGLLSTIKFSGSDLPNKTVGILNQNVKATDSLFNIIDLFILEKKCKFAEWGK